jgi:hypothetical protein
MSIKYINIFQSDTLNIFPPIEIFGLKTNYLTTLAGSVILGLVNTSAFLGKQSFLHLGDQG